MSESRAGFFPVDRKAGAAIRYTDLAFITSRPPDIPSRNRIVAVCGIFDSQKENDIASPSMDGFFFRDFFLFHNLLHPVNTHSINQTWLTAESPEGLVRKYREFAHGSSRGERRVVLDHSLLPQIKSSGTIRVVEPEILLDRFVKAVQEQAELARERSEALLILIFGHGQPSTYHVEIGGKKNTGTPHTLSIDLLKRTLPKTANITIFMTSCYSGGWLVQPNINHTKHLNVMGIAGSGPDQETRSWSLSKSLNRACGTSVASAILETLLETEQSDGVDESMLNNPTYMGLCAAIYDKAQSLDHFITQQQIYFSAQGDEWEEHWGKRTGAPLIGFRARWESLRAIPPSETAGGTAYEGQSNRRMASVAREFSLRAKEYMDAKPGRDSWASNTALHSVIMRFFKNGPRGLNLEPALEKVKSRLGQLHDADDFIGAMGIEFKSCLVYSLDDDYPSSPELDKKVALAFKLVAHSPLLPQRLSPAFHKPLRVIAIALTMNCDTEAQMIERLDAALKFKAERDTLVLPRACASQIINDPEVIAPTNSFVAGMKALGHTVRMKALSMTPTHKGYQSVPVSAQSNV
ncbi:hypothetical protein BJX76DRAFT_369129 [Aspergillus varians]